MRAKPESERSSLQEVLSLVVTDPVDGRIHEVPLRFLEQDGCHLVLAAAGVRPRWFDLLLAAPQIEWRVGFERFHGVAVPLEDTSAVRARFEAAFGSDRVLQWYGPQAVGFAFQRQTLSAAGYREDVEDYFDRASGQYDRLVGDNPLDRYLRSASLAILQTAFKRGDRVLEIGSGTGLETLPLALEGVEVVAVDISARMLERLESKAAAAGVAARVHPRHMAARDIARLEEEYECGSFQGAYSTFGALNCEPAWRDVAPVLARLLAPGATLVLGVWNRVCLFELAAYLLSGHPRRAFARLQSPAPVGLTRFGVPVFAFTVGEFLRTFSRDFEVRGIFGLPVVLPPYDLGRYLPNTAVLMPLLAAADEPLRRHFPFNRLGDHFVLVLRRRS